MKGALKKSNIIVFPIIMVINVTMLILYTKGYNYLFSLKLWDMIHLFVESILNITAASIFLLMHYSYPYENNTRYVISGSLFLSLFVTNTLHMYYYFGNNMDLVTFTSNLTHMIVAVTLLLSAILPERRLLKNRWIINSIPTVIIILSVIYISIHEKSYAVLFLGGKGTTAYKTEFNILLALLYLSSLTAMYIKSRKDESTENISLFNGVLFFIISWIYTFLYKQHNDIYALLLHIFKITAIAYVFRAYFVINIKRPHQNLVKAREMAEEANNIKTDFIVNLSHELRTPVNIILNAVKLVDKSETGFRYLKSIEKNSLRLNKVFENLILFNEIENNSLSFTYSKVDIVFMIDEILEEADEIADEKSLEIIFDFKNRDIILTDSEKFKMILLNLISNTIKYSPQGGLIKIILNVDERLELEILNNGPGISDGEKIKIFNKFYKSKDINLLSTEGLGIGLYISKRYCELLGGTIEAISENGLTGYKLVLPFKKTDSTNFDINFNNIKGYFADIS